MNERFLTNFLFVLGPQIMELVDHWIPSTSPSHYGKFGWGVMRGMTMSTGPLQFSHVGCLCKRGLLKILLIEVDGGLFVLGFSKLERKCISWFIYSLSYFWCCQSKIWQLSLIFKREWSQESAGFMVKWMYYFKLLFWPSLVYHLTCGHYSYCYCIAIIINVWVNKWTHRNEILNWIYLLKITNLSLGKLSSTFLSNISLL